MAHGTARIERIGGMIDADHRRRRGGADRDLSERSPPAHLHAIFAGREAKISIVTGDVHDGTLPRPKLRVVLTWLAANREQVSYIWREIRAGRSGGGMVE